LSEPTSAGSWYRASPCRSRSALEAVARQHLGTLSLDPRPLGCTAEHSLLAINPEVGPDTNAPTHGGCPDDEPVYGLVHTHSGAALVGVADTAAYLTGTTVEAALAELGLAMVGTIITDPGNGGAIPVTRSGTCAIVTSGAQTRTLAAPTFVNQRIVLYFQTDGGDCVVTVANAFNVAGNTIVTLNDVNDSVQLVGVYNGSALRWRLAENDGCALS